MGPLDAIAQGVEGSLADGHHQELHAQGAAEHGARVAHTLLGVHGPGDGQEVDGPAAGQAHLGHRRGDGAGTVALRDGPRAQRDAGGHPAAVQLSARRGHGDAGHRNAGNGLGALHRLSDGFHSHVGVDDHAGTHAARLDVTDAGGLQGPAGTVHVVRLHDEAGHLRSAQIHRSHQRLAAGREHLQAIAARAKVF